MQKIEKIYTKNVVELWMKRRGLLSPDTGALERWNKNRVSLSSPVADDSLREKNVCAVLKDLDFNAGFCFGRTLHTSLRG